MTADDLETVRSWRNRPEVRENMFARHVIGAAEHRAYFERALSDPAKPYLLCVAQDGAPIAVVNFVDIDDVHGTANWGFYTGAAAPPGTGSWLGLLGLTHAFRELRLQKVSAEVLDWNARSVRLHQVLGFRIEGTFRAHHVATGRRHDVHRLAILAEEWQERRPEVEWRLRAPSGTRAPFEPGLRRPLFDRLRKAAIGVQVHYLPVYWHPYYARLGYPRGLCPVAERFYAGAISLPIFPAMQDADVTRFVDTVRTATQALA